MTGNDLSRLLRDGTPEPRRALAADDLLRRARRRRAARAGAAGATALAVTVAGVALALPGRGAPSRAPIVAAPPSPGATGTPGSWPEGPGPATDCVEYYPTNLANRPNAFDATVVAVTVGPRDENAGGSPSTIDLRVHRVYAGPRRETVRLGTWDFMLPRDPQSVVGLRVLAATGSELHLSGCGYARPWSRTDADVWERVFGAKASGAPEDDCGIRSQPLEPGSPDESRLEGMRVEDAVRDVESRGLTARLVGDGVTAMTSDYNGGRVTICNRDGVVTAAARF